MASPEPKFDIEMFIKDPVRSRCARGMQDFQNYINKEKRKFALDGQKHSNSPSRQNLSVEPMSKTTIDISMHSPKKASNLGDEYIKDKMNEGGKK